MIDGDSRHLFKSPWPGAELFNHSAQGTFAWIHSRLSLKNFQTGVNLLMIHAKVVEAYDTCEALCWIRIA